MNSPTDEAGFKDLHQAADGHVVHNTGLTPFHDTAAASYQVAGHDGNQYEEPAVFNFQGLDDTKEEGDVEPVEQQAFNEVEQEAAIQDQSLYEYEGLEEHNYLTTEYIKPSIAKAKEYAKRTYFQERRAPICGTTSKQLRVLGAGLTLYFSMQKALAWLFFVFSIVVAPVLALCFMGTRVTEEDVDPLYIAKLSIGNLPDPTTNATLEIFSQSLSLTTVGLIVSYTDLFYTILFLFFVMWFTRRIASTAKYTDSENVTASDYSVYITNIPKDVTDKEVFEHFNRLYDLEQPDW
ncbi:unnamed protein product, partial [Symbiodinium sp. KB8]